MTRIVSFITTIFFLIILSASSSAVPVPIPTHIHRLTAKSNPVGGSMRPKDWHMTGDTVHAHDTMGLSFNTHYPENSDKKKKVWTIDDQHFNNHPSFHVVHDGHLPGRMPGHVTLAYHGEDIHKDDLKAKIHNLPWHQ